MSSIIAFITLVLTVAGPDVAEYNGYQCGNTGEFGPRSGPKSTCQKVEER